MPQLFGGGGGGGGVSGLTEGAVLFGAADGTIDEDATNFFWDDANDVLTIGSGGSYTLAGDGLEIAGKLEVDGNVRFDGIMGWNKDPFSQRLMDILVSGATIGVGIFADFTYTGSAALAGGLNVLEFSYSDQSTSPSVIRAIAAYTEFDRSTAPSTNTQVAIEVTGYGPALSRAITSGTYTWRGMSVTASTSAGSHSGGTVGMIDLELGAEPSGYSGVSAFTHHSLKCNGKVWVANEIEVGIGTSAPGTILHLEQDHTYGTGNFGTVYLGTIRAHVTARNGISQNTVFNPVFLDVNDPTLVPGMFSSISVTNYFFVAFDAALGTHKMTTNADKTGNAKVGTIKVNANGTLVHLQLYAN